MFCSSRTIDRWVKRFHAEGVEGLAGHKPGRPFRFNLACLAVVVYWVTTKLPSDFGFLRSRWTCGALALLLWSWHRLDVSPDANPMERIWWLSREHVTRNHRCHDPGAWMGMVMAYLAAEAPFRLEDEEYQIPKAA